MADIRALYWADLLQRAEAGDLTPLADALRGADPADVPREVLVLVADVMTGRRPRRRPGPKATEDRRQAAEITYLALRAAGKPATFAVDEVARRFALSRAGAYRLIARVRPAGDKLAELRR